MSTERRIDNKSDDIQLASDSWRDQLGFSLGDVEGGGAHATEPGAWIEQFCLTRLEPFVQPVRAVAASPIFRTYTLAVTQQIFEALPLLLSEEGVLQRLADYTESVVEQSPWSSAFSRDAARPVAGGQLRPTQAVNRVSPASSPVFTPARRSGAAPVVTPLNSPAVSLQAELERPWPVLVGADLPVGAGVMAPGEGNGDRFDLLTGGWGGSAAEPVSRPSAGWLGAPIAPPVPASGSRPAAVINSDPESWRFLASVVPDQTEQLPTRRAQSPAPAQTVPAVAGGQQVVAASAPRAAASGTPAEAFTVLRGDSPEPAPIVTVEPTYRPTPQPAAVVSPLRPAVAAVEREAARQEIPVVRPLRGPDPASVQAAILSERTLSRPGIEAGVAAPTRVALPGEGTTSAAVASGATASGSSPVVAPLASSPGQPAPGWPSLLAADGAPGAAGGFEADVPAGGVPGATVPAATLEAPVSRPPSAAPDGVPGVVSSLVAERDITAGAERFVPVSSRAESAPGTVVTGVGADEDRAGVSPVVSPLPPVGPGVQGAGSPMRVAGGSPDTSVLLTAPERQPEATFVTVASEPDREAGATARADRPAPASPVVATPTAAVTPTMSASASPASASTTQAVPVAVGGRPAPIATSTAATPQPTPAQPGTGVPAAMRVEQAPTPITPTRALGSAPVGPQPFAPLTAQPPVEPVAVEPARIGEPLVTATRALPPTRIETAAPVSVGLSTPTRLELTPSPGDEAAPVAGPMMAGLPGGERTGGLAAESPDSLVGELISPRPAAPAVQETWPSLLVKAPLEPETVLQRDSVTGERLETRADFLPEQRSSVEASTEPQAARPAPVPVVRPEPVTRLETPQVTALASPMALEAGQEEAVFGPARSGEAASPVRHLSAEAMVAGTAGAAGLDAGTLIAPSKAAQSGRPELPVVGVQPESRLEPGELGPLLARPAEPAVEEILVAAPLDPRQVAFGADGVPRPEDRRPETRPAARPDAQLRPEDRRPDARAESPERGEVAVVQPTRPAEPRAAQTAFEPRPAAPLVEPLRPGDAYTDQRTGLPTSGIRVAPARGPQSWLDVALPDPRVALEADASAREADAPVGPGLPGAAGWPLVIEAFSLANAIRQAAGTVEGSSPATWQTPTEALSQLLRPMLETGVVTPEIEAELWPALNVAAPAQRAEVRAALERALTATRAASTAPQAAPVVRPMPAAEGVVAGEPGRLETLLLDAASDIGRLWDERPFTAGASAASAPRPRALEIPGGADVRAAAPSLAAHAGPGAPHLTSGAPDVMAGAPDLAGQPLPGTGELTRSLEMLLRSLDRFEQPTGGEIAALAWTLEDVPARAVVRPLAAPDQAPGGNAPVLAGSGSRAPEQTFAAGDTRAAGRPPSRPTVARAERQDPVPTGESARRGLARRAGVPLVGFSPIDADWIEAPGAGLAATTADSLSRLIWLQSSPDAGPGDFATGVWEELPPREVAQGQPLAASGRSATAETPAHPVLGEAPARVEQGAPLLADTASPVVRPEVPVVRGQTPTDLTRPALVVPGQVARDSGSAVHRTVPRGGEMLAGSLERLVRNLESTGSLTRFVAPERTGTPTPAASTAPAELFEGPLPALTGVPSSRSADDMRFQVVLGKPAAETPARATFAATPRPKEPDVVRRPSGQVPSFTGTASSHPAEPAMDDTIASVREALARQWNIALPTPTVSGGAFHPLPQTLLSAEPVRRDDTGHAQGVYMQKEEPHPEPTAAKHEEGHAEIDPRGLEQVLSELKWRMRLRDRWEAELE